MPTLESISIKGFKSIRDVEVKLRDINVLIGANGSGKSNFLEVFSFLQAIQRKGGVVGIDHDSLREYVARAGGAERLLHFGSRVTSKIDVLIGFRDALNPDSISLFATDSDTLTIGLASLQYMRSLSTAPPQEGVKSQNSDTSVNQNLSVLAAATADSLTVGGSTTSTTRAVPLPSKKRLHCMTIATCAQTALTLRRFSISCAKSTKIRTDSCGTPCALSRRSSTTLFSSRLR